MSVLAGTVVIEDLWYKNAVIYCLDVERFLDANGDGVGDFAGLNRKLDYLVGLGVSCLWLQPFYRTPNRDNGYDISDYYSVDPRHGSLGEFVEFINHARQLGLRVIVDLVVNHTSDKHPWFESACTDPDSPHRDWYVWADERPENHHEGVVFPPMQRTTWTREERTGRYYFHRFYRHQPDLDTAHPAVRREILRIMGFWLELGVSGFRIDAVPFLISAKGAGVEPKRDFELLHEMRDFMQWRCRDAVLLAEANVAPGDSPDYFGPRGDRMQMILNFPVNQALYLTLATADVGPLARAIAATAKVRPPMGQWVNFLRSHDELDLARLTDGQRQAVFDRFAPKEDMQLYGRGIRRRLAPMLHGDRRRLELAYSLLLALPGTPMLLYGDEIGMGDDLSLPERESARTPMQWSDDRHGGFTVNEKPIRPVVTGGDFGVKRVNVIAQQRDPESLLSWFHRVLRRRRECHEIGWGDVRTVSTDTAGVLVLRYRREEDMMLTLHNFSDKSQRVQLSGELTQNERLIDVLGCEDSETGADGSHVIELPAFGYRWLRPKRLDADLPEPRA